MHDSPEGHRYPALLTDLYEITMAQGYWKAGVAEHEAVFHLTFRRNPFGGGLTLACGLEPVIRFLEQFRFEESDLAYLAGLHGNDGAPLFEPEFLRFLAALRLTCDIDAMPEGTVAFPHEPLVRVQGPVVQAQILETAFLNQINFSSLIATKAARVCLAARGAPVMEFGLRRAQGMDGGLTASRAACIGGCASTSNVLAGKMFDIPVAGTQAHSWVMFFDHEREAFERYADAMPNNCTFLVDTYDSREGIRHAIEAGRRLRQRGHEMIAVRLDSGDLAALSIEARRMLDDAGFSNTKIVGTGDLDEHRIAEIIARGAEIDVWGVGTNLVTASDDPALGGVYKLSARRGPGGAWQCRIKLSEDRLKGSDPGRLQVRRYRGADGRFSADAIYDLDHALAGDCMIVDRFDPQTRTPLAGPFDDLLVPIFRRGERVYDPPGMAQVRARVQSQLASLDPAIQRLATPQAYRTGLEEKLHALKTRLVEEVRRVAP